MLMCTKCGEEEQKPYTTWCRTCCNVAQTMRYRKDPSRAEYVQDYNLRKNHGITKAEYDLMFFQQGGVCAICGQPEMAIDPRHKRRKALAVDHNHETGQIRELLCTYCNSALGYLEKDRERVRKVLQYLKRHDT